MIQPKRKINEIEPNLTVELNGAAVRLGVKGEKRKSINSLKPNNNRLC